MSCYRIVLGVSHRYRTNHMFTPRIRPTTRLQQRALTRSTSSSSSSSSQLPPPRPSYFSRQTLYPFLLLSAITSLALNLSHSRSQRQQETSQLSAQITVLEALVARLQERSWPSLTEEDRETVERELELVGLGRGKGKKREEHDETEETSWGEVLFGKKGKAYEPEKDDTDWEKGGLLRFLTPNRPLTALTLSAFPSVFKDADAAEVTKQAAGPSASPEEIIPTPSPSTPVSAPAPTPKPAPPKPRPASLAQSGIYL